MFRVVVVLCLIGSFASACWRVAQDPAAKKETKYWTLLHAKAEDVAEIVREQFGVVRVRLSVDKDNNQIIATGTVKALASAFDMVEQVDIEVISCSSPTYAYWFHNQDASVLLPFLQDMASYLHRRRARDEDQSFHPEMVVRHDPIQNRILMFGYGPDSRTLLGVLKKIDVE